MKTSERYGLRLFLSLFLIAGIAIGVSAVSNYRLASETDLWPTAEGLVTKSESRGVAKKRRHNLRYSYTVDGRQYEGQRSALRDGLIKHRLSDRVSLYPVGQYVTVYYSPEDPNFSILETGVYWPGVLFAAFASVALIAVGGGGIALTFR